MLQNKNNKFSFGSVSELQIQNIESSIQFMRIQLKYTSSL